MAVKGDVGKLMFENAGGTEADISDLRAWSLTVSKDTLETTKMGDTSKSFVGGLISVKVLQLYFITHLATQIIKHLLMMF